MELTGSDPALRDSPATVGGISLEGERSSYAAAYFDDALFDGEPRTFTFDANLTVSAYAPLPETHLVVTSMSEEYFEYHRHLDLQRRTNEDPLGDPTDLYSNVEDGTGVFSGYASTALVMPLR